MDGRFLDIDAAAKGTCNWLLWHQTFKSWASCGRGLLWIKGKPGSGKSTLLRYVLDHVMEIPNTGEGALILSFFFHGRGTELQRTPLGLFRSLLHQLLCQVPEALTDLVTTFQQRCETVGKPGEKWQWHPRELPRLFESSFPKVLRTRPVWLFVDALDESGQKNAVRLVREFKSLIQGLPSTGSQFHICFTCRHYPILDQTCQSEICLEEENRQDISTYVRAQLSVSRELTTSTIPELITKHAQGVFIWAYLVVDQILDLDNGGVGLRKIEDEIYSIPPDLDDLYHDLIRNMDEKPASLKLIQWICFSVRPLSLDELRWAMIVDADCPHKSLQECKNAKDYISDSGRMKRRVQTLSRGLIEVTSDAKVVQFIHQSVKDFFTEKGLLALDKTTNPDFVVEIAHHRLSRTCIRYLAMEEIGRSASHEPDRLKSEFPFLHYATTSWVTHIKQSDTRNVPQEDLLEYFAGPSNTLMERWVHIYRILKRYSNNCPPEGASLVHVISMYGVAGALWTILEKADQVGINIDGKDASGRTPLWWAAAQGNEAIVRLLLDRSAHIEAADDDGWTPLLRAAENGHETVVRLLLDRSAHIEAADDDGWTPLLRTAEQGNEAIVRLLLDRDAYIEAVDKWRRTPLWWAAARGHEAVVWLLLDKGAHIEAADDDGWTPLLRAAENGHLAVVRLLLERGVYTEVPDKEGRTPLWWAAARGHEAVVWLLLDKGAHIEAAGDDGWTPLLRAAEHGHLAVVRLLLDKGAHTEAVDKWGRTPLWRAAEHGHEAVVWLLLDKGAHIEAAGDDGWTPLSWAAERGHLAVVRLLLDKGAHTEAVDKWGRTPLLRAAENGHETIVRLLLDRDAYIEAVDKDGRTPLSWAAERGHLGVVRLLLDRDAYVEAADDDGWTPLLRAAENGHETVVRLLLDRDAYVEAADDYGWTPLLRAAENGHETVLRLLLDREAYIETADRWGRTPLWRAAENGHLAVVRLLLDREAYIETADRWGRTPLLRAAARGHEAVVRLLLDQDAYIEAVDKVGRTPLWWAAERGHEAVVRLLQFHVAQPSSTASR
ncbi:Ankyrin repeat domain-containing protein 50 [Fusarium oxysporum f. sp. conglutinans]|nr:Ankyrin repeat domain-containing protein 50 [Fusarium oxysporum f. sp. conglutinans]